MRMFDAVTIVCGEDPEQAHAIRAGLEELRLRVFLYHAVQMPHLVDFFAGRVPCGDHIVVMGACGHGQTEGEDWPLEDPKGQPIERVREIRDDIHGRVVAFATRFGWIRSGKARA